MLLMLSSAEFYAVEIICYTHFYPTRTVTVTIYVTGDMIKWMIGVTRLQCRVNVMVCYELDI